MNVNDVHNCFLEEFGAIADKFEFFNLSVEEARTSKAPFIWHPGVYIWWHKNKGVVKVGRHLTNARKRALEHLSANTGGCMKEIESDPRARLLLFVLKDCEQYHWAASVEIFLEKALQPIVKSTRQG